MNTRKKWMVSLSGDYFDWIKETSSDVGITGSQVIEELIGKARTEPDFKDMLKNAQVRIKEAELLEKKRQIEEQILALKKPGRGIKETQRA